MRMGRCCDVGGGRVGPGSGLLRKRLVLPWMCIFIDEPTKVNLSNRVAGMNQAS
jgi:hypothetical protein